MRHNLPTPQPPDLNTTPLWDPNPALRAFLFTDFDGLPAEPDDVIADALDGGYAERTEGLVAILRNEDADPAGRFLACCALASWADRVGYAAVVEAAAAPEDLAWRGQTYDRFNSQDDTFAHLAEAVGRSRDMIDEPGISRLATGDHTRFDLGLQLTLFANGLAESDPARSSDARRRLLATRPGERALRELATDAPGAPGDLPGNW